MANTSDATRPDLSIVVPMHNEAENVGPLHDELLEALAPLERSAELIFVDDGSTDETFDRLRDVHGRGRAEGAPAVKVIRLRRRCGKGAALAAGFDEARGSIIVTLDGDGQDDPKEIPRFLDKLDEGCDLVSGWKRQRKDRFTKVIASRIFNFVVSLLTGIRLNDFNCGFKAYRAQVVGELQLRGGLYRYIPVMAHAKGYRCGEIEVEHRPRTHGRTKYGLGRLVTSILDLLTVLLIAGHATRPLRFLGVTGIAALLAGFAVNAYLAILWFAVPVARSMGNRPLLLLGAILIVVGIQLTSMCLIGELVISRQATRGDAYSVAERLH